MPLGSEPHVLPPREDYDVAHLNWCDNAMKPYLITAGFVFAAVLEPDRFRRSLYRGIEQKVRKAAARIVPLQNGTYEFHIPKHFTNDRPPCAFTVTEIDGDYDFALPPAEGGDVPTVYQDPGEQIEYFIHPTCPRTLQELVAEGGPALRTHLTIFKNATLLGITYNHALLDAIGIKFILEACVADLRGELDGFEAVPWDAAPYEEVKRVLRETHDESLDADGNPAEADVFRHAPIPDPRVPSSRLIRIPKSWLAARKAEVARELEESGGGWVSTNDVLLAYMIKTTHIHRKDDTPVCVVTVTNLRLTGLPEFVEPRDIGNAHFGSVAEPVPARVLGAARLSATATHFRKAIAYALRDQAAIRRSALQGESKPAHHAPGVEVVHMSNWRAGGLDGIDVGAGPAKFVGAYQYPIELVGRIYVASEQPDALWLKVVREESEWEAIRQSGIIDFA